MPPLSKAFNIAVLQCANRACPRGWAVADTAPATLGEGLAMLARDGRPTVWSGASDATVFGDAEINYAFRAWHDAWHYRLRAPFNRLGEQLVCAAQCADIRALYGSGAIAGEFQRLLKAEIMGQLDYHACTGEFPADQRAFCLDYLASGALGLAGIADARRYRGGLT